MSENQKPKTKDQNLSVSLLTEICSKSNTTKELFKYSESE